MKIDGAPDDLIKTLNLIKLNVKVNVTLKIFFYELKFCINKIDKNAIYKLT